MFSRIQFDHLDFGRSEIRDNLDEFFMPVCLLLRTCKFYVENSEEGYAHASFKESSLAMMHGCRFTPACKRHSSGAEDPLQ